MMSGVESGGRNYGGWEDEITEYIKTAFEESVRAARDRGSRQRMASTQAIALRPPLPTD